MNKNTKSDFFYKNAEETGDMPSKDRCKEILNVTYNCEGKNFITNKKDCLDQQLCKNKELGNDILQIQQSHSGSVEKHNDSKDIFNREVFKTANLSIGIIGLLYLTYRFRQI